MQKEHAKQKRAPPYGRKGNSTLIGAGIGVIALVAVIFAGIFVYDRFNGSPAAGPTYSIVGNGGGALSEIPSSGNNCGTDRTSTITFSQTNALNTTASEAYNSTCYLYSVSASGAETYVTTLTNTDGGQYSGICNQVYRMRCVSTDANGGDSGQIQSIDGDGLKILTAKDSKERDVSGAGIEFLTNSPKYTVSWKGKQHATLQFRTFDVENNNYMYNEEDSTTSDYETDGVNFTSTSGNTTALAVGSGGTVHIIQEIQATDVDTDFSDFGFYVGVKAAKTTWDQNSVSVSFTNSDKSTKGLANVKGNLDDGENSLFDTAYQYVYFVPDSLRQKTSKVDLELRAITGINPGVTDDIEIDYISKGSYLSSSGTSAGVKFSASTDASSPAAIYAVQDTNIAVS